MPVWAWVALSLVATFAWLDWRDMKAKIEFFREHRELLADIRRQEGEMGGYKTVRASDGYEFRIGNMAGYDCVASYSDTGDRILYYDRKGYYKTPPRSLVSIELVEIPEPEHTCCDQEMEYCRCLDGKSIYACGVCGRHVRPKPEPEAEPNPDVALMLKGVKHGRWAHHMLRMASNAMECSSPAAQEFALRALAKVARRSPYWPEPEAPAGVADIGLRWMGRDIFLKTTHNELDDRHAERRLKRALECSRG